MPNRPQISNRKSKIENALLPLRHLPMPPPRHQRLLALFDGRVSALRSEYRAAARVVIAILHHRSDPLELRRVRLIAAARASGPRVIDRLAAAHAKILI